MDELLKQIRQAVDGLLYPSESDEPFNVFSWPPASGTARDQIVAHAGGQLVTDVSVAAFFDELNTCEGARAFAGLRILLEALLPGLEVFRVGNGPEVGIFLIGRLPDGAWTGARTISVET